MQLTDLRFSVSLLEELERYGFETVEDMAHLQNSEILSIPGMGGAAYRRLASAMGREAFAKCCRSAGRPKSRT
jgi:hypothetical protein